jgi:hypothetical protein
VFKIFEHPLLKDMAKNWKKIVQPKVDNSNESSKSVANMNSQNEGVISTDEVQNHSDESLLVTEHETSTVSDLPLTLPFENEELAKLIKERELLEKEFEALISPQSPQEKEENTRFNNPIESIAQKKKVEKLAHKKVEEKRNKKSDEKVFSVTAKKSNTKKDVFISKVANVLNKREEGDKKGKKNQAKSTQIIAKVVTLNAIEKVEKTLHKFNTAEEKSKRIISKVVTTGSKSLKKTEKIVGKISDEVISKTTSLTNKFDEIGKKIPLDTDLSKELSQFKTKGDEIISKVKKVQNEVADLTEKGNKIAKNPFQTSRDALLARKKEDEVTKREHPKKQEQSTFKKFNDRFSDKMELLKTFEQLDLQRRAFQLEKLLVQNSENRASRQKEEQKEMALKESLKNKLIEEKIKSKKSKFD